MSGALVGNRLPENSVSSGKHYAINPFFWLVFPFCTPWKHQKNFGFFVFSGGIK